MPRTKQPKTEPPKPRLTMDKVADRLQQECDLMRLLNNDLLDVITLLIEMAKSQADMVNSQSAQVKLFEQVNERLKWIHGKYSQAEYHQLDSATLAKLYRFMAEADGVQIVPMVYGKPDEAKPE